MRAFLLFYPYYLLMFALSLYLVESGFKELFHSGDKINKMYRLLQKFKIVDSDQEDKKKEDTELDIPMEVAESESIQLKFFFKRDNNCFLSYLTRTVLEILLAGSYFLFIIFYGDPILEQADIYLSISTVQRVVDYAANCNK